LIYLIKFSIAPLYKILNPIKILKRKRKRISRYIMEGNGWWGLENLETSGGGAP
jgi:hypothetical protein